MKAAIVHSPRDLRIEEAEIAAMGPRDVKIRIRAGGSHRHASRRSTRNNPFASSRPNCTMGRAICADNAPCH